MKVIFIFLINLACLCSVYPIKAQIGFNPKSNALEIIEKNKSQLENVNQVLVVYNHDSTSCNTTFIALEKVGEKWIVKLNAVNSLIGKKGFALPGKKLEGDGKSPTGIFKLGKLFSYEKQDHLLFENQQTSIEDKWIDDINSPHYNSHIRGYTEAKSFENLLLYNDSYKYCIVIEYNTNPVVKKKGSAIFLHLALKDHHYTLGCVAIQEKYMKIVVKWLDSSKNPVVIMRNLATLKLGS